MPRTLDRLSARRVATLHEPGFYADGGGLYLNIAKGGSKSWIFRYKVSGRVREMGLGPVHTISLSAARERAKAARIQRLDGIDPIEERRRQRQQAQIEAAATLSFAECAERYAGAHQHGWRPRTAHDWRKSLDYHALPVFGSLPVAAVDTALIMKALEPIWTSKTRTASNVRQRIEAVLGWATTAGYRSGDNPARWKGHLENLLPKEAKVHRVEHHAALPYADLPGFMVELAAQKSVATAPLQFLILTAARVSEVLGARWSEIDFESRTWTVPADRMKGGKEHRVPLSEAAVALLRGSERKGDLVFPGARPGRPITDRTLLRLAQEIGQDATVHGFRSTFRDWCAERTAFPREVAEMALAHSIGSAVEQAYRRGDLFEKRRQLAEAWARYCYSPAGKGAEVVAIRG